MATTGPHRRLRRALLAAAVLALLAVVAVVALVRTTLTGGRLVALVTARADAALAGRLEARRAGFRLPLHLELEDVVLRDPAGRPVLTASRVDVGLSPWPLLRHTIALEHVSARGVWADLATDDPAKGRGLRAATAAREKTAPESRPWALRLADGAVDGLTLRVARGPDTTELGPADIHVSEVAFDPGRDARVGRVEVSLGSSRIAVSGTATDLATSPAAAVRGDATLSLGELASVASSLGIRLPPTSGTIVLRFDGDVGHGAARGVASLEGGPLAVAGLELADVACRATVGPAGVDIGACTVTPREGGAIHASGHVALEGPGDRGQIVLDDVPVRAIAGRWLADDRALPERVSGVVDVGPPAGPSELARLSIRLDAAGASVPGVRLLAPATTVAGTAGLSREAVRDLDLAVASGSLRATVRGSASLAPGGPAALDVTVSDTRPEWLGDVATGVEATHLRLVAHVGPSLSTPTATGVLTAEGVRASGLGPFVASVPLRVTPTALAVQGARVVGNGGTVRLDGEVAIAGRARPVRAVLDARLELSELGVAGLAGRVSATARVSGRLSQPLATARIDGRDLVLRGVGLGTLTATLDADPSGARARAHVALPRGNVDVAALYGADGSLRAEAHARGVDVAALDPVLPSPIAGAADLDLAVQGAPRAPVVQGHLTVRGARVADVDVGTVDGELGGSPERVASRLTAEGPSGTLSADVDVSPRTHALAVVAHATRLDLDPWLRLAGVADYGGRLDLDLHADGVLPYPDRLTASGRITGLVVAGTRIEQPLALSARSTTGGRYGIDASLGDLATATAVVGRGPPLSVTGHAAVRSLAVESFVPRLVELGVSVTTSAEVDASWVAPADVSATATITALEAGAGGQRLHAAAPVRVRYARGEATLDELHLVGDHGVDFRVAGAAGRTLDLRLGGELDLGLAAAFVPAIAHADGAVRISAQAGGTAQAPVIAGEVDVFEPVVVRPRSGVREVRLERGRITASTSGSETTVDGELQGALEGGAFAVSGKAAFAGLTPRRYDVSFSGQNLPVRTENLVIEANPSLRVTGNASRALVGGKVDIVRGRYLKKFELKDFNFVAREPQVKTSLAAEAPWLGRVELDVTAVSEAGLQLRVDAGVVAVDLQLSSDVHVGGTAVDPQLEGRIEASRGTLRFPKAQLEVSQAVVELTQNGGTEIDLRADGEVTPPTAASTVSPPTYFIQLQLSGSLDQMSLDLTSTPELNRLEILALLVRGEANLLATGAGGNSSTLDAALAFAGSQLTGPLSQFISDQLERTLNLKLELGAEVTSTGVRLTASQQLTPRLSIQGAYERSLGTSASMTSATARLLLTDRLFLQGSTQSSTNPTTDLGGQPSESRLELKWRLFGLF